MFNQSNPDDPNTRRDSQRLSTRPRSHDGEDGAMDSATEVETEAAADAPTLPSGLGGK